MKLSATGELYGRSVEEWVGKTPDSKPPKSVTDRVFLRQEGKDAITGEKMFPRDKKAVDHIRPLKDGGENRESNLQIILATTHKEKTAAENKARAKETRQRLKHQGLWPRSPNPIRSRGFQKPRPYMDPDT